MNKIVGLDIGENSVKMAYFVGRELKRTAKLELPDAMVSGGRILSMDAMADFLHDAAKGNGIPLTNAALVVPASEVYTRIITLPAMKPQLMFGAVMSITSAFAVGDITVALCGNPSTDYAVHTVINHLNDYGGTRFEMGYACAIATILFLSMIVLNEIIQKLLNKVGR